jgi:hypothetical protein
MKNGIQKVLLSGTGLALVAHAQFTSAWDL